jgi:SulP family sulfate permease
MPNIIDPSAKVSKYAKLDKKVFVKNINRDCKKMIDKAENLGKIYFVKRNSK